MVSLWSFALVIIGLLLMAAFAGLAMIYDELIVSPHTARRWQFTLNQALASAIVMGLIAAACFFFAGVLA